jgi:hypothetical protein
VCRGPGDQDSLDAGVRVDDVRRTTQIANRDRGVGPLDRLRAMNISLKVPRSWLGVLGTAARARLQRVRVTSPNTGRRRCRQRPRSLGTTDPGSPSTGRHVWNETFRITDPVFLPGKEDMSSISRRRHSHGAGRGSNSQQCDGLSVIAARPGRRTIRGDAVHKPPAPARRVYVASFIPRSAPVRRLGPRGWCFFRLGSACGTAWASWRGAACASSRPLRPERERPCSWAASGASRSGDIFIYVVPGGCRP